MPEQFRRAEQDTFAPNYGGIDWMDSLRAYSERTDMQAPVYEYEATSGKVVQITQENTLIYWNLVSDAHDAIAIRTDENEVTWWFREDYTGPFQIEHAASTLALRACQITTMYPLPVVVQVYEQLKGIQIPDALPEDFA